MATVDIGMFKTSHGLIMLLNLAAAIAGIVFWELSPKMKDRKLNDRAPYQIYYTCALAIACVVVGIIFFLTLCGKLTKRVVALVFFLIATILMIAAVITVLVKDDFPYKTMSLMCAAVLSGGMVANLVYTGVGGIKITS